jgi:hypothetical protein
VLNKTRSTTKLIFNNIAISIISIQFNYNRDQCCFTNLHQTSIDDLLNQIKPYFLYTKISATEKKLKILPD